jgi:DNA-binding IclR family transcriptional regulator
MIDVVQSVDRALSILEILSENVSGMGLTEISSKINLHKSTVHRLLGTLISNNFVTQDSVTNKYKITIKLYELGVKKIATMDILEVSKPYTKALMKSLNEVVHLVIRDKNDIIYIDKVEADNTIRMASTIGRRSPLYCTSVGKSMMANMTNEEIKQIWKTTNIQKLTGNTITDYDMFLKELKLIREKGYAEDDEENEMGVRCIGAPIFNHKGEVEGAISISGPSIRVTKDKVEAFAKEVKKYARLISIELGYEL